MRGFIIAIGIGVGCALGSAATGHVNWIDAAFASYFAGAGIFGYSLVKS